MSAVYLNELDDFLREKGKGIKREESFALYGYAYGLYQSGNLSVEEFAKILDKIPVDTKELDEVTL